MHIIIEQDLQRHRYPLKYLLNKMNICREVTLIAAISLLFLGHAGQTITKNIHHEGRSREYILYVPDSYDKTSAVPLVFNFHGYSMKAKNQMNYGDFRPIADTAGFIIVHPQGLKDKKLMNHFNAGWETGIDDLGFTKKLIKQISSDYLIDSNRIYSTGMSNGGFMSYFLALKTDLFAAIASVTGGMNVFHLNQKPLCATSILEIHGTKDKIVPFNGRKFIAATNETIKFWVKFNGCDTHFEPTNLPDIIPSDNSTITHHKYQNSKTGKSVELYEIHGAGHTWPGTTYKLPKTNYDISASLVIWDFFSRHTK